MFFTCDRQSMASAILLLLTLTSTPEGVRSHTITSSPKTAAAANPTATCEFRTINYITDSLPQLCFKSSWSANASTVRTVSGEEAGGEKEAVDKDSAMRPSRDGGDETGNDTANLTSTSASVTSTSSSTPLPTETEAMPEEVSELDEGSFLSFEDWKKQALEKAGQQNAQIGSRKVSGENRRKDSGHSPESHGPFGEEGEIDIDFAAFRGSENEQESQAAREGKTEEIPEKSPKVNTKKRKEHRSKDAGITCKERFSYSSFDAGATVVKTHQGAKNSKSILIENKDSYMLSVCSKENKFVIIELSEDIWIDTVVLANYEFFSSMIRQFRVSVSDHYPAKLDKWKNVGIYEARNSREIQAFLIENPQIWARYIRIEFVSHYGNEYYCPLSLVRVHGTRMLESWKESEANGDDDDAEEENEEDAAETSYEPEAVADAVKEKERQALELRKRAEEVVKKNHETAVANARASEQRFLDEGTSPWVKFRFASPKPNKSSGIEDICLPKDGPTTSHAPSSSSEPEAVPEAARSSTVTSSSTIIEISASSGKSTTQIQSTQEFASEFVSTSSAVASNMTSSSSTSEPATTTMAQQVTSQPSRTQVSTGSQKNKTSGTSSASSSLPTIQESFFKAVSRRLQSLETNSTLSLKYIEEQSRILREAFSKVEKKQSQKTTSFLDTLNSTVLTELRGFRQQYDEIWQSTVISLESQREESRREIIAISARLNILADEVVFQKRMSIVQSVLLLLCLGLVIFSRVSSTGQGELLNLQNRFRNFGAESPLQSAVFGSSFRRMDPTRSDGSWADGGHNRVLSDDFGISRSGSFRNGAQTPTSIYSRSDYNFTPPSGPEEVPSTLTDEDLEPRPDHLEPPRPQPHRRVSGLANEHDNSFQSSKTAQSSPARSPRKRKDSFQQVASPPPEPTCSSIETTPEPYDLNGDSPGRSQIGRAAASPSLSFREPALSRVSSDSEEIEGRESRETPFSISRKPLPALPPTST
ncbi:Galactose-binding protein [Glarea lozoyensis ATCC 20868]|uniref:Galactose-binding protein n=1 Tax=Glarea lozoyensis (strain ATCC 20868 / MF5171) TaxID=1116229 RepID=S3D6E8_GLAL2|nr:Galactose-binding protein [Glarea lozoyensis ATCC 20868]EPE34072.1 Galactose-binding protein [Glarea lozoyensis ATCC 20868]